MQVRTVVFKEIMVAKSYCKTLLRVSFLLQDCTLSFIGNLEGFDDSSIAWKTLNYVTA